MPTYTYKCPKCGWTGDRQTSIATRDHLRCDHEHEGVRCEAALERDDTIPAAQGRMAHNWSRWQS